ncbi:hypothetical protein KUH03_35225 [Sphingobacterium sp. E70]|uniref:hypothetical protein n=1 Tax=Sphingobacterium sp. E70 TaxID=2853439 RepID=UPI00211C051B|nr:hypothetical protein [Sphingobacterium sp. E70]ULT24229.1 hypothetical protein KUH03_35225 [Sphingobacterium sp. E70]
MDEGQTVDFVAAVIPELNLRLRKTELKKDYKNIVNVISQFAEDVIYAKDWRRFEWVMQVVAYVLERGTLELQIVINGLLPKTFSRFKKHVTGLNGVTSRPVCPFRYNSLFFQKVGMTREKQSWRILSL